MGKLGSNNIRADGKRRKEGVGQKSNEDGAFAGVWCSEQ